MYSTTMVLSIMNNDDLAFSQNISMSALYYALPISIFNKGIVFLHRSYYNVKSLGCYKKFTTPYGARLEWDLESPPTEQNIKIEKKYLAFPCRLILHLKDKFLIRNKKRSSQVRASNISLGFCILEIMFHQNVLYLCPVSLYVSLSSGTTRPFQQVTIEYSIYVC